MSMVALEKVDSGLVERIRRGDEQAFAFLYRRHAGYVAGVAYRLIGDDQELDDIVQETFLEAARGLDSLEDPARVRRWLVTIAVRRVQRRLGMRSRRRLLERALTALAPLASDPRHADRVAQLYQALGRMPQKLRVAWALHRIEGESLPEVAKLCGTSLTTAKRRIADAEARLQRRFHAG